MHAHTPTRPQTQEEEHAEKLMPWFESVNIFLWKGTQKTCVHTHVRESVLFIGTQFSQHREAEDIHEYIHTYFINITRWVAGWVDGWVCKSR